MRSLRGEDSAIVMMEVEGYEAMLLDPDDVKALRRVAFVVELHEFAVAGIV